ncbi:MAG: hypothetical protein J6S45_03825, partial [Firmicutes bacterium]|nr:hypothetical protein [Bacillota bacterium]
MSPRKQRKTEQKLTPKHTKQKETALARVLFSFSFFSNLLLQFLDFFEALYLVGGGLDHGFIGH